MNSKQLKKIDKQTIWHPFTQMQEWVPESMVVIEKGKGSYLYDTDGKKYLDGVSSLWCNVHGHQHPKLDQALSKQIKKVAHSTFLGLSNVPAIELSQELIAIAPKGLKRAFYSDSGSESTEIALKMAYQYWQHRGERKKKLFLKLENAYHGDTVGAVSIGGIQLFHDIFKPLLFKTLSVKAPHRYGDNFKGSDTAYAKLYADKVEAILKKRHANIAAMIVEPLVQGAAGILVHPRGYLKRIRQLTKKYNVLLIVDEVATGFGRTGKMFACEHENISPDILCIAKGLSGGYLPIAATLTTEKVYQTFLGKYEEYKTFFHGHTYTANPLACAVSVANIRLFKSENVLAKAQSRIEYLAKCLTTIIDMPHVADIRQCGFMVGIELTQNKLSRKPYTLEQKMGATVCERARKYGVLIRPLGNTIVLMPPFSFSLKQIHELVEVTRLSIQEVTQS
ncbi:MAG: adenosylmethionine-8-amino-7-oxononanoate aminotransferase [Candidatus Omnitrophota bacterium]|jgi:adenosylmethionine-8-amino-7-oxononanoate aminotransferase